MEFSHQPVIFDRAPYNRRAFNADHGIAVDTLSNGSDQKDLKTFQFTHNFKLSTGSIIPEALLLKRTRKYLARP